MSGRGRASYPPSAAALAAEPPRAEPPPEEGPRAPSGLELLYTQRFACLQRALDDARPAEAPRAAAPAAAPAVDSRTPPQGAADAADRLRCVVCLSAEKNVVFMPCMHVACCGQCANGKGPTGEEKPIRRCPMCRGKVKGRKIVYI